MAFRIHLFWILRPISEIIWHFKRLYYSFCQRYPIVVIFIIILWNFELQHALSIAQSYFRISPCPQEHILLLYVVDGKKWSAMFLVVSWCKSTCIIVKTKWTEVAVENISKEANLLNLFGVLNFWINFQMDRQVEGDFWLEMGS